MTYELADDDLALMLLIRRFEEGLLELFAQGRLDGTTHTCLGQEYVPVALRPLLGPDDWVFSNHRGHGHYLSRFVDPAPLLAEIMGRDGGICGGMGGSQHLRRGRYLSSGVQAESLPVAVGVALDAKQHGSGSIAVAYVGDGTFGAGGLYESLNLAALWQLPLLVVVENNHIAQTTPAACNTAGTIAGRAAAFGIDHHLVTSHEIPVIRRELTPIVDHARMTSSPLVVEFDTVRLGPHSKGDDTRDPAQLRDLWERDWLALYAADHRQQCERLDAEVRARMATVVAEVAARPPATGLDRGPGASPMTPPVSTSGGRQSRGGDLVERVVDR